MLPKRGAEVKLVSSNGGWEVPTEVLWSSGQTSARAEVLRTFYPAKYGSADCSAREADTSDGDGGPSRAPGSPSWARLPRGPAPHRPRRGVPAHQRGAGRVGAQSQAGERSVRPRVRGRFLALQLQLPGAAEASELTGWFSATLAPVNRSAPARSLPARAQRGLRDVVVPCTNTIAADSELKRD